MKRAALILTTLALAVASARAGTINLALTQAYAYASPGDTVALDATMFKPWTPESTTYLITDSSNVDSPLTLDDTDFFLNFPAYLNAGDTAQGTLFTVFVPIGTPIGVYAGYFEIDGGDPTAPPVYLDSAVFNVEVGPGSGDNPPAVPEPATLVAASAQLLLLAALGKLRR
jgi:hypothetical protein